MVTRKTILKVLKWIGVFVVLFLIIGTIVRIPHVLEVKKTAEQVAKIHATKLKLADVMGEHLPPDPGIEGDKTIPGIDANTNGIRDDVELAIFKEYPDSPKIRAALLQYALALQMDTLQGIINKETVGEVIREQSRAHLCVSSTLSRDDLSSYLKEGEFLRSFVLEKQRNIEERKKARDSFIQLLESYKESENKVCDVDLSSL